MPLTSSALSAAGLATAGYRPSTQLRISYSGCPRVNLAKARSSQRQFRLRLGAQKSRDGSPSPDAGVPSKASLLRRTKAELEQELAARGLSTSGLKQELVDRLHASLSLTAAPALPAATAAEAQGASLAELTKAQLQVRLSVLGLPKTGKKEELIARLENAVAAPSPASSSPATPSWQQQEEGTALQLNAMDKSSELQGTKAEAGSSKTDGSGGSRGRRRSDRLPPVAAVVAKRHERDEIPSYAPQEEDEDDMIKEAGGPYAVLPERAPEADLLPAGMLEEGPLLEDEQVEHQPAEAPSQSQAPSMTAVTSGSQTSRANWAGVAAPKQPQSASNREEEASEASAAVAAAVAEPAVSASPAGKEEEEEGVSSLLTAVAAAAATGEVSLSSAQLPTAETEALDELLLEKAGDVLAEVAAVVPFAPADGAKAASTSRAVDMGESPAAGGNDSQQAQRTLLQLLEGAAVAPAISWPPAAGTEAQLVRAAEGVLSRAAVAASAVAESDKVSQELAGAALAAVALGEQLPPETAAQLEAVAEDVLAEVAAATSFAPLPEVEAGVGAAAGTTAVPGESVERPAKSEAADLMDQVEMDVLAKVAAAALGEQLPPEAAAQLEAVAEDVLAEAAAAASFAPIPDRTADEGAAAAKSGEEQRKAETTPVMDRVKNDVLSEVAAVVLGEEQPTAAVEQELQAVAEDVLAEVAAAASFAPAAGEEMQEQQQAKGEDAAQPEAPSPAVPTAPAAPAAGVAVAAAATPAAAETSIAEASTALSAVADVLRGNVVAGFTITKEPAAPGLGTPPATQAQPSDDDGGKPQPEAAGAPASEAAATPARPGAARLEKQGAGPLWILGLLEGAKKAAKFLSGIADTVAGSRRKE